VSGSGIGGKNGSPEQENAVMEGSTAVRISEAKIKEAILHADIEIRDRATSYFAKSFSSELSIMPSVIQAMETYGRQSDAYRLIGASREQPHHGPN
jgi:hypothetical protein